MVNFDLSSWAGIAALTVALVSAVKSGWKGWASGKEPKLAMVLALVLTLTAHATGAMAFAAGARGWVDAVIGGILAGVAAQVGHDYLLDPVLASKEEKK